MIIALVSIWLIFTVLTKGSFLSTRNLAMLARQTSGVAIIACGMVLVIVAGHIDLSVGSILGLTGGLAAILQVWYDMPTAVVVTIAVIVGAAIGLWHGAWIAYGKVPAFIVTLAGYMMFRGVLYGITKSVSIAPMQDSFVQIGQGFLPPAIGLAAAIAMMAVITAGSFINRARKAKNNLPTPPLVVTVLKVVGIDALILVFILAMNAYQGLPVPVTILLVLAAIFTLITNKTKFGRNIYALGGNLEAARYSGINTKRVVLLVYVLIGALSAISGVILTARLNAATSTAGTMAEMDVIAACVIGGTSMSGGTGTVFGAIVGALVMSSLDNGMGLLNIEYFWQYIVKGMILLVAVFIDVSSKKKA